MYHYRLSFSPNVVFNGCMPQCLTETTPGLLPKYANGIHLGTQLQMPAAQHADIGV